MQEPAVLDPATHKTLKGQIETNVAVEEISFAEQRMNFKDREWPLRRREKSRYGPLWGIRKTACDNSHKPKNDGPSVRDHK